MEDYLEALRVDRSGTAGSWQGSASYTVTLAIAKVRGTYIYNWTGEHVTDEFKAKVYEVANKLGVWPEDLMAVMAFESWLDPSTVNSIGATGPVSYTHLDVYKRQPFTCVIGITVPELDDLHNKIQQCLMVRIGMCIASGIPSFVLTLLVYLLEWKRFL